MNVAALFSVLPAIDATTGTLTYTLRIGRSPSSNEGMTALHQASQTGKRDLVKFLEAGYALRKVQPFDLFPQTRHLECVMTMTKS